MKQIKLEQQLNTVASNKQQAEKKTNDLVMEGSDRDAHDSSPTSTPRVLEHSGC